ncbi:MAG: adenosine kinase [Bacteroidota bacterium]
MQKVLGIGNALVDTLVSLKSDDLLKELELPKGSMQLVDADYAGKVAKKCENYDKFMVSGGCGANTIHALASLGTETGFIGKVGKDELGEFFINDLSNNNISPKLTYGQNPSGHAMAFVTPDGERTFATYLGAALELTPEDLEEEIFKGYDILHVEGYLLQNHSLLEEAFAKARKNSMKVSLDLASFNVVEDNLDVLKKWIKEDVDIVFANEEEAKAYTGKEPEEALEEIASQCEVAVVKIGKNGSMLKRGNESCKVPAIEANVVDTTGAGDAYASGVLYGLAKGLKLEQSGRIASILSGKVIENMGARLSEDKWPEIKKMVDEIEKG